jgi:chromosomal replication initiation ATPase DnaA
MGNIIQFFKCGKTLSEKTTQEMTTPNHWKRYCRELDALHIEEIVTKLTGYTLREIRRDGRKRDMAEVRQLFVLLAREHTTCSYPKLGMVLNRDHSTIMQLDKRKRSEEVEMLLKAGNILADEIKERVFGPPVF